MATEGRKNVSQLGSSREIVKRSLNQRLTVYLIEILEQPWLGSSTIIVGDDHERRAHQQKQHDHADHKQQSDSLSIVAMVTGVVLSDSLSSFHFCLQRTGRINCKGEKN